MRLNATILMVKQTGESERLKKLSRHLRRIDWSRVLKADEKLRMSNIKAEHLSLFTIKL